MLRELVTLWPGGPAMTFASYFVTFKYVFTVAFLCWAIGILRWPNRWWLFGGSLLLAALAWTVLELPLGRPYGVVEGEQGLSALAQPMVAAARGTAADGWMVHQPNPQPLWSLVLAFASGFDPGRLFSFYDFIPLVGMIFLASAVFWFMGAFDDEESTGLARGLAVFFVLFLSSTRLSFLETPGPFWLDVFGQRPHLAFALGLLVIWLKLLGGARRLPSFLGAGALLGLIAWMEPRVAAPAVLGAIAWVVVSRGISTAGWKTGVTLTVGALLFLPWSKVLEPAGGSPRDGRLVLRVRPLSWSYNGQRAGFLSRGVRPSPYGPWRQGYGSPFRESGWNGVGSGNGIVSDPERRFMDRHPDCRCYVESLARDGSGARCLLSRGMAGAKPRGRSDRHEVFQKRFASRLGNDCGGGFLAAVGFPILVASGTDGSSLCSEC